MARYRTIGAADLRAVAPAADVRDGARYPITSYDRARQVAQVHVVYQSWFIPLAVADYDDLPTEDRDLGGEVY